VSRTKETGVTRGFKVEGSIGPLLEAKNVGRKSLMKGRPGVMANGARKTVCTTKANGLCGWRVGSGVSQGTTVREATTDVGGQFQERSKKKKKKKKKKYPENLRGMGGGVVLLTRGKWRKEYTVRLFNKNERILGVFCGRKIGQVKSRWP